ncbi:hypothetical protein HK102_009369, partial [Quaeritorhiza haematococci]
GKRSMCYTGLDCEKMTKPKIAVLISGFGSNLQALIDAAKDGTLNAEIALVVSNRKAAYGLQRAQDAGIPTMVFPLKPYKDQGKSRVDYDIDLARKIVQFFDSTSDSKQTDSANGKAAGEPDLVVLAGWMHILSAEFLDILPKGRVMNLHPALPGQFDGAHAIERAFTAFKEGKIQHTGVMVHRVIPEVDRGEVILQRIVPIEKDDTLESLEERIHKVEHGLIVEGANKMLESSQATP